MPEAATPLSNHAAGFDYLLSQSPSQAQPTPHGMLACTTQPCAYRLFRGHRLCTAVLEHSAFCTLHQDQCLPEV